MTGMETLSDHMYVGFSLEIGFSLGKRDVKWPRWNLNTFNKDTFEEIIRFRIAGLGDEDRMNAEQRAKWLTLTIVMACDCAAKRVCGRSSDRCKYWWS